VFRSGPAGELPTLPTLDSLYITGEERWKGEGKEGKGRREEGRLDPKN